MHFRGNSNRPQKVLPYVLKFLLTYSDKGNKVQCVFFSKKVWFYLRECSWWSSQVLNVRIINEYVYLF